VENDELHENLQAAPGLMPQFIYQIGMVVGRHRNERMAYLAAFGRNLKVPAGQAGP